MTDKRVVWILGAGFSVPLGAPLFRELISDKTLKQLRTWKEFAQQTVFMDAPQGDGTALGDRVDVVTLASIVHGVYKQGFGPAGTLALWSDAEQFLDLLEIASSDGDPGLVSEFHRLLDSVKRGGPRDRPHTHAIRAFLADGGLKHLHTEAIRFVAGACTVFLSKAEQSPTLVRESEQWSPYRRWVRKLQAGDSVVTFNYDRVLNVLNEHLAETHKGRLRKPPVLDSPVGCDLELFDKASGWTVPMYHLHGHVGWCTMADGFIDCGGEESTGMRRNLARAHCDPAKALLGTPGRVKTGLPNGSLKVAWQRAMDAISNATSIVFVGYRFPETDNVAKEQLADALRNNPKAIVHVVLGAHNPDMPRLKGMIEWTRDKNANPVHVHEMWCQDFFAVFERNKL